VSECDSTPAFSSHNEVDKRKTQMCMIICAHSVCPRLEDWKCHCKNYVKDKK